MMIENEETPAQPAQERIEYKQVDSEGFKREMTLIYLTLKGEFSPKRTAKTAKKLSLRQEELTPMVATEEPPKLRAPQLAAVPVRELTLPDKDDKAPLKVKRVAVKRTKATVRPVVKSSELEAAKRIPKNGTVIYVAVFPDKAELDSLSVAGVDEKCRVIVSPERYHCAELFQHGAESRSAVKSYAIDAAKVSVPITRIHSGSMAVEKLAVDIALKGCLANHREEHLVPTSMPELRDRHTFCLKLQNIASVKAGVKRVKTKLPADAPAASLPKPGWILPFTQVVDWGKPAVKVEAKGTSLPPLMRIQAKNFRRENHPAALKPKLNAVPIHKPDLKSLDYVVSLLPKPSWTLLVAQAQRDREKMDARGEARGIGLSPLKRIQAKTVKREECSAVLKPEFNAVPTYKPNIKSPESGVSWFPKLGWTMPVTQVRLNEEEFSTRVRTRTTKLPVLPKVCPINVEKTNSPLPNLPMIEIQQPEAIQPIQGIRRPETSGFTVPVVGFEPVAVTVGLMPPRLFTPRVYLPNVEQQNVELATGYGFVSSTGPALSLPKTVKMTAYYMPKDIECGINIFAPIIPERKQKIAFYSRQSAVQIARVPDFSVDSIDCISKVEMKCACVQVNAPPDEAFIMALASEILMS